MGQGSNGAMEQGSNGARKQWGNGAKGALLIYCCIAALLTSLHAFASGAQPIKLVITGERNYQEVKRVVHQIKQTMECDPLPDSLSPGLLTYKLSCPADRTDLVDLIKGIAVDRFGVNVKKGAETLEIELNKL